MAAFTEELSYRFCDDWLIYAEDCKGRAYYVNTALWPEWMDVALEHYPDMQPGMTVLDRFWTEVIDQEIRQGVNTIERYMLPIARRQWEVLPWQRIPDREIAEWQESELELLAGALQAVKSVKQTCEHPHEHRTATVFGRAAGHPISYRGRCEECGIQGPIRHSRDAVVWAFGHMASMYRGEFPGSPGDSNAG